MADEDKPQTPGRENKIIRKRTSEALDEGEVKDSDEVNATLKDISKCFGVGGLFSSKKRKIETNRERLPMLNEEWFKLDLIKDLSRQEKKRYADEMSSIAFKNVGNLRKMVSFFNQVSSKSKGRKQVKDISADHLLKDIKTNHLLPIPERYCEMGLWKQIIHINQQVWKLMESLEEQDKESNSSEKDPIHGLESEVLVKTEASTEKPKRNFRDFYMDMMTANFSEDLEKLKKDSSFDHKKVSLLIDCLETGKDIWSDVEKELLQSLEAKS